MPTLTFTDDQAENRRVWAEWLRRPDWQMVPRSGGEFQECRTPWDAGYALAIEGWPSSRAIMDQNLDAMSIGDEIMVGCYGLGEEGGEFLASELPDRIRSVALMASQAACSASPYPDIGVEGSREMLEDLPETSEWSLYVLSFALTDLWEYDPSPMRGAVLGPREIARLIADILDAAPPSLLDSLAA